MSTRIAFIAALFLSPAAAPAADPEALLQMCKRDARNALSRAKTDPEAGARTLQSVQERCVDGPEASVLKALPGYADVLRDTSAARETLNAGRAKEEAAASQAQASALASGPGGDRKAIDARWKARPPRCQSAEAFDQAAGNRSEASGAARISGLEGAGLRQAKTNPRLFSGRDSSGRMPALSADEHLVRLMCGVETEGIDPYFNPDHALFAAQLFDDDHRVKLARVVQNEPAGSPRLPLLKTALAHYCFVATEWSVERHYDPFLYCQEAVGAPPGATEVEKAMDALYAGRDFEKQNMAFLARRGVDAMREVMAAFGQIEERYPRMKAAFRDSAVQARERFEARRKTYSAAFAVLDPLTARLLDDPTGAPPASCEEQLLGLRSVLAKEIPPRDEESLLQLRAGHPLGYQITEALAWCYLGRGKLAKADLEAGALRKGVRRVTLAEEIALSREQAMLAVEAELKTREKIVAAVPNYECRFQYPVPLPGSMGHPPRFDEMAESKARFERRGERSQEPAVVVSQKPVSDGVEITFTKYTSTSKYRDLQCKETDKIDHFVVDGNRVKPIYRKSCWEVGPVKTAVYTHQEKAVIIAPEDAALVKPGMQLVLLVNAATPGDAALLLAGPPGKGAKEAAVLEGIALAR
ncbi:MAG: hypothetical protein HY901_20620 [Deltaproteobacteria bacterium]|nr:hypothetical protein [Deltaproteobacteria bacterium]